jgi:hypothetical protein
LLPSEIQRNDGGAIREGNDLRFEGEPPSKLEQPAEFVIITAELVEVPLDVESSVLCGWERLEEE